MGRKRKAQKAIAHDTEDNACSETATSGEETYSDTDNNSNPADAMNIENTTPPQKINSKDINMAIRRSGRLKNSVSSNRGQKVEAIAEHVNLIESESESESEEEPDDQQVSTSPGSSERNMEEEAPQIQQLNTPPVMKERNLEEKIDSMVRTVDEFKSTLRTLKQVARRTNVSSTVDLSYKSLYINSQKNIEALMEEHYELVKRLEFAKGKIDAYEKMHKVMAASKEVILVPRPENDAEAKSLSPQAVQKIVSAPSKGAPDDQNSSPLDVTDDHKVSTKQKKTYKRRKVKS